MPDTTKAGFKPLAVIMFCLYATASLVGIVFAPRNAQGRSLEEIHGSDSSRAAAARGLTARGRVRRSQSSPPNGPELSSPGKRSPFTESENHIGITDSPLRPATWCPAGRWARSLGERDDDLRGRDALELNIHRLLEVPDAVPDDRRLRGAAT